MKGCRRQNIRLLMLEEGNLDINEFSAPFQLSHDGLALSSYLQIV